MKTKKDTESLSDSTKTAGFNNYHSLKNGKAENHVSYTSLLPLQKSSETDWSKYEVECSLMLNSNVDKIVHFREHSNDVPLHLRDSFTKKVSEFEVKNKQLHANMEAFMQERQKELQLFNEMQLAQLELFKKQFNLKMEELI